MMSGLLDGLAISSSWVEYPLQIKKVLPLEVKYLLVYILNKLCVSGISLSAVQWKKVVSMADEVDDAIKKT